MEAKARIWPWLSYMCHMRSTAAMRERLRYLIRLFATICGVHPCNQVNVFVTVLEENNRKTQGEQ